MYFLNITKWYLTILKLHHFLWTDGNLAKKNNKKKTTLEGNISKVNNKTARFVPRLKADNVQAEMNTHEVTYS